MPGARTVLLVPPMINSLHELKGFDEVLDVAV